MSKLVLGEFVARCINAEPISAAKSLVWAGWQRDFIGREGWLAIYKSEVQNPGRNFLYFYGGDESEKDWNLRTSYGEVYFADDKKHLLFYTRNTRYVFLILQNQSDRGK